MSAMSASSATATVLLVGCRLAQQDAASGERRVADRGTEVREVAPQDQAARLARGGASGLPGECPPPRKQSDAPLFPHRKNGGNAHGEPDWSQPIEPGTFYRNVFKPAVKRAGLENVRLHDLRHTCASILLTAGMSPYELSEQLGHSGYQITLDVYARQAENWLSSDKTSAASDPHLPLWWWGSLHHLDAALGQQLLHIPVGQPEPQIPAHRQHDHLGREPVTGERRA
jgi:hypothetical protein